MESVEIIFARAAASGWDIQLGSNGPKIIPRGEQTKVPPKLLAALKANRSAIVAYLNEKTSKEVPFQCKDCSAWWFELPTLEVAETVCYIGRCQYRKSKE